MTKTNKLIYFFITTLFFVLFDTYFSSYILKNLDILPQNEIMQFVSVQNTGAAFSILQNSRFFLITFSIIAIILVIINLIKNINKTNTISIFWVAMLISGIICNTYERITLGYVRDFFHINFINFPVFNISDIFINVSVFAIVIIIIKYNYIKNNENNNWRICW